MAEDNGNGEGWTKRAGRVINTLADYAATAWDLPTWRTEPVQEVMQGHAHQRACAQCTTLADKQHTTHTRGSFSPEGFWG